MKELEGRVALVTGAGRNIGRAIALELAAAGAHVVVNAKTSKREIDTVAAEVDGLALLADVTDEAAVERMVAQALARFGRLDILVNNAAVRTGSWREVTSIILDGAWHCSTAAGPHLSKGGTGAIINIGGMSAHTGAAGRAHVVAAKSGLVGLTRALAHDLAPHGVTVNCVVPGLIETARTSPSAHGDKVGPLGRRGTPQEVAAVVRFLAGPGARYITGQTLHVNGGAFTA
ncbi:MAG TPA: SDR family oxidoreductase [Burkholderiales bacterium]|nr:SDR family oxidoreductase [Burkholderiales bacterium]